MSVDTTDLAERRPPLVRRRERRRFRLSVHAVGFVTALVDLAIIVSAALLSAIAYHLLFLGSEAEPERYATIGIVSFVNFVAIAAARRAYETDALLRFRHQAREVVLIWGLVSSFSLSLIFVAKVSGDISRGAIIFFFVAGLIGLLAWRRLLKLWMARAIAAGTLAAKRVILIADQSELSRANPVRKINAVGYAPVLTLTYGPNPSTKDLGELVDAAVRVADESRIDSIMLMANWSEADIVDQVVAALRVLPLSVHLLPDDRTGRFIGGVRNAIPGLVTAELQRAPLTMAERAIKRAFDIGLALFGLVLLSPLLLVVAALIKLDSAGPVFFLQPRNGFNARQFRILKFRTMKVETDAAFSQATREDRRTTRVGRWLRKTSIDELPQLWNVLRGEMSIVGPRPHPIALNSEYQTRIGSYAFRHHVKPGLTGWAQVRGLRGETKTLDLMQRRVDHDLYYINNWSFWLDLLIVLLTVRVVFGDRAAF